MCFSLFLVLVFASGLKASLMVKGSNQNVLASAGEDVILNCSVDSPPPIHEIEEVTWKKKDGDVLVLLFQDNEVFPDSSHQSYQGRAEFFITEIPKGNFSLKLTDVTAEDDGEFICEVHTHDVSARTIVVLQSVDHLTLKGADQAVVATAGEDVILDCSVDSHQPLHEIEEVTWKKKDGDLLVLFFQNNETFSDSSHESYRGRAEFFITEIPKGNFSLKLKDVRLEDKGEFICEIHSSDMFGRTVVFLESVGFSRLHILIFLFCIAAPLTVGIFLPFLLKKKTANTMDLIIHVTLMLCPNICLFVAFILWFKEGFLSEVVICSVVCFARPMMLMGTFPYLNTLPDCFQKAVKGGALLIHHSIIIIATISTLIDDMYREVQGTRDLKKTLITVGIVAYFIGPSLSVLCLPFWRMKCFMISATLNRLLMLSMMLARGDFDLILQIISIFPPLFLALMMVLSLQSYYTQGKLFRGLWVALSGVVVLYAVVNICYCILITMDTTDFSKGWILLFEAVIYIIIWLGVICLLRSRRTEFCNVLRGKEYLCCTVTAFVLTIVFGALYVYYTAKLMENRKDGAGYFPLTLLVLVLAATVMYELPENVPDLLQIVIYVFGTLGLTVINSATLASELIQKAVKGARTIEDLRLIVLPSETLIVLGWLVVHLCDTWMRTKGRINQDTAQSNERNEGLEMEHLKGNTDQQT